MMKSVEIGTREILQKGLVLAGRVYVGMSIIVLMKKTSGPNR